MSPFLTVRTECQGEHLVPQEVDTHAEAVPNKQLVLSWVGLWGSLFSQGASEDLPISSRIPQRLRNKGTLFCAQDWWLWFTEPPDLADTLSTSTVYPLSP
jgi:hypothetical protein